MTNALKRRARRAGFEIVELLRVHPLRFLIAEKHAGLIVRGSEEKPLSIEDCERFLTRFDDPDWLP